MCVTSRSRVYLPSCQSEQWLEDNSSIQDADLRITNRTHKRSKKFKPTFVLINPEFYHYQSLITSMIYYQCSFCTTRTHTQTHTEGKNCDCQSNVGIVIFLKQLSILLDHHFLEARMDEFIKLFPFFPSPI